MSSVYAGVGSDTSCLLLNQQHMIADTVRMIRHCQSDQPGEFFSLQSELSRCSGTEQRPARLVRGSPGSASPLLTLWIALELLIVRNLPPPAAQSVNCSLPESLPHSCLSQFPSNHLQTVLDSLYMSIIQSVFTPAVYRKLLRLTNVLVFCPSLRQRGDRGGQCGGEGERSLPAHHRQSADAFWTVTQTGATRLNTRTHVPP